MCDLFVLPGLNPIRPSYSVHHPWLLAALGSLALLGLPDAARCADLGLAWDPVVDDRVAFYEVHWGIEAGQYQASKTTETVGTTVTGLDEGETYYFAARACDENAALCSEFSEEISTTVDYATPQADFSASTSSGVAPLAIDWTDLSTGTITSYQWDFGDGHVSSEASPAHVYMEPGTYAVTLIASGPGGSTSKVYPHAIVVTGDSPNFPQQEPPVASFTESADWGLAPLSVSFTSLSSGEILEYQWDFGDGATSNDANPAHTYQRPGVYDVTLAVSGPFGSDSLRLTSHIEVLSSEIGIEIGEVSIDHEWRRVDFEHAFVDPIVIVKPLSGNGGDPAVTRIDGVDGDGFWVRVQEWEYLDGEHIMERVGYMVIERGLHQLPDGNWIEADRLEMGGADGYLFSGFNAPFMAVPVVVSSVSSVNDAAAVTTRMRGVDQAGFEIALQEEEASTFAHGVETIAYVAWEPSFGEIDGLRFEVGQSAEEVTHVPQPVVFGDGFDAPPVLLADLQTANGRDTANLRWRNKGPASADLWVDEEQSKDAETKHVAERVGFIALSAPGNASPMTIEVGELEVDSAWQRVDLQQGFIDPVVVAKIVSAFDPDPVVVSIDAVDTTGFSIRLQEWDYLDDIHAPEIVSFVVVERGRHQLPDGAWLEAGRIDTDRTNGFQLAPYSAPFSKEPVVLTSVTAYAGPSTVTTRVRRGALNGFEAGLQAQESNKALSSIGGTISFIAWEPSSVDLDGLQIEVGRMADRVTHAPASMVYAVASALPPVLLADMQTTNGTDASSLRLDGNDGVSVALWVQEEQSRDAETRHVAEEVGYLLISEDPAAVQP